jgi:hypothetical protein
VTSKLVLDGVRDDNQLTIVGVPTLSTHKQANTQVALDLTRALDKHSSLYPEARSVSIGSRSCMPIFGGTSCTRGRSITARKCRCPIFVALDLADSEETNFMLPSVRATLRPDASCR